MVDIVTRAGKGSPLTNNEVDANFTNLAEVSGVTGEPMGHEDRTTSTISFNASTRTFTIAPVNSSFTVWCKGKKVIVSSAQTVTIPNTSGMHSIYYDANGTLSSKIGYFTFSTEAPTAYVYWNATTGAAPYFGDERHGVVLDWQTHEYLHRTRGAAIANGFLASGYTLNDSSTNAATQIAIESGTFFDEDMKIDIVSTATPTAGTYQQNLLFPAKIPVLHLQGTSWVMDAPTDFPFKQGTSRPQYNSVSGGVWSTTDVGNNQHATTWILATNNLTYPVIAIIGQSATDNLGEAEAFSFADLTLTGFPSVEFRPLYKLIYKASDGYANSVNAQLVSIVDLRSISAVGSAANPATDHGNLSGLSDDDHPQYLSVDTVRSGLTAAVKASFLPSQTGNAGKFLTTDATSTSWASLTSGNITTALGFTPYNATNPAGYITGITSSNVTTALGFTPYNATNPSGFVTAAGARGAISVTGAGSYDSATGVINIVGGVTSFNTRTGAITLSSADVTTALGFTPYNSTNPNGYLTGITSTQVTTALGYTPYNSSNPSGYITGITSGMVTTALGFTPYNNSNPSGYITSSALSGYLTSASAASTYLPLAGGTLTGPLAINGSVLTTTAASSWGVYSNTNGANYSGIWFSTNVGELLLRKADGTLSTRIAADGSFAFINGNNILHAGNYNSYSPTLTGTGATGTWAINISGNAATATLAATATSAPSYLLLAGGTMTGSFGLNDVKLYLRTNGDNNHYLWNAADDWEELVAYSGTGFRVASSTGATLMTFTTSAVNAGVALQQGGNQVLHAGNYTSYALPLTAPGLQTLRFDTTSTEHITFQNQTSGGAIQLGFQQNDTDGLHHRAYFKFYKGSAGGVAGAMDIIMRSVGGGTTTDILRLQAGSAPTWAGSTMLTAANYSSYALPLSGGGLTGNLGVLRKRLTFSSTSSDANHSIYNNYDNIDGEGSFDGMKMNVYAGLRVRVGNASGAVPTQIFSLDSSGVRLGNGNASPAGTGFSHTLAGVGTNRVVNFDGNGNGSPSVWWTNGSRALAAIDGKDPGLTFWANNGSGWQQQMEFNYGTVNINTNLTHVGNQVLHAGNYSSYALPIGGGTVSGRTTFADGLRIGPTPGDPYAYIITRTMPSGDPNAANEATELLLFHSNDNSNGAGPDYITLRAPAIRFQTYDNPAVADPDASGGWNNRLTISPAGAVNSVGALTQGGNQVLHAANINSYIPNWSFSVTGNHIVQRDGNGYIYANHINFNTGIENPTIDNFITGNGDGWSRKSSLAHVKNSIRGIADGTWGISITGSAAQLGGVDAVNYFRSDGSYPNADMNTPVEGFWHVVSNASGLPEGYYGHRWDYDHLNNGQWVVQMYSPTGGDAGLWFRQRRNFSWEGWRKFLDSSNYGSYALPLSGGTVTGTTAFTRTDDNAISVGTIRGRAVGGQGGDFLHLYERVHIGSPAGWGSRSAPSYGLSTYGGCALATDTGSVTIGGNTALHAGNFGSYAINRGGDNISGIIYFQTNRNGRSGNTDSAALQAYSTGNNSAFMSFHKGGHYATNMGLDDDNVMRIGGWSAAANRWQLDMSGNMTVAGNVTAYSDERFKKDWGTLPPDYVERLAKIKSGTYTRIDSEERQAGVSAQNWQTLLPETVSEDNEGTLSLAYGNAALVSAVELAKDVVDLRNRVAQLESLINKLIGD